MIRWSKAVFFFFIVAILLLPTLSYAQSGQSPNYTIAFNEKGLPNGTNWSVSVGEIVRSSNNSTVTFLEPDGSYNFVMGRVPGYRPLPSNFTVVVRGSNITLVVVWIPVLYPVTFVESGLPANTFWNVTLGNQTNYSSNSTITFKVMNGTYEYNVPDVNGVASSSPSGTIKVNGEPTKVFLQFTVPINFTFIESGLPAGSKWSVFIDGSYHNSTSSIISFNLPNRTYSYLITLPSGYYAKQTQGLVDYSNNLVVVNASSSFTYEIVIAILAVLIVVLSFIYIRMRRRTKPSTTKNNDSERK